MVRSGLFSSVRVWRTSNSFAPSWRDCSETWKLWLWGFRDLDEHNDFKARFAREVKQGLRRGQLADAWFAPLEEKQRRGEQEILPALAHGRAEIDRLKKLAKD